MGPIGDLGDGTKPRNRRSHVAMRLNIRTDTAVALSKKTTCKGLCVPLPHRREGYGVASCIMRIVSPSVELLGLVQPVQPNLAHLGPAQNRFQPCSPWSNPTQNRLKGELLLLWWFLKTVWFCAILKHNSSMKNIHAGLITEGSFFEIAFSLREKQFKRIAWQMDHEKRQWLFAWLAAYASTAQAPSVPAIHHHEREAIHRLHKAKK